MRKISIFLAAVALLAPVALGAQAASRRSWW
jgi:hypothetical protein